VIDEFADQKAALGGSLEAPYFNPHRARTSARFNEQSGEKHGWFKCAREQHGVRNQDCGAEALDQVEAGDAREQNEW
jgi:hypothetical protein